MKRLSILLGIVCLSLQIAVAQKADRGSGVGDGPRVSRDFMNEVRAVRAAGSNSAKAVNAVSPADVGEADSFGRNARFLGTAGSGAVFIDDTCDPVIMFGPGGAFGPDDQCVIVTNPNAGPFTTVTLSDVARINLPKDAASNIVYMVNNHTINWTFQNALAVNFAARIVYIPEITIESVALNDPAAINPQTGLPMNGSYTTGGSGTKSFTDTLFPNTPGQSYIESYSRANTAGLSRAFWAANGLPNNVINELFKKPMTIRLNVRLTFRGVAAGQFLYSARLFGD